ncbi:hypothetical protein ACQY0O_000834 [Thecaphora frezii]
MPSSSTPPRSSDARRTNGTNGHSSRHLSTSSHHDSLSMDAQQYEKSLASFINDDEEADDGGYHNDDRSSVNTVQHRPILPTAMASSSAADVRRDNRGSSSGDADGNDDNDSFVYAGKDGVLKQEQEIFGDYYLDDSDSYSAKMREILGSDDDDEDGGSELASSISHPNGRNGDHDEKHDDESLRYPEATPQDVSFNVASGSSSGAASRGPQASPNTPGSAPGGWPSARIQVLPTPQRPAAYPLLSRLRSSASSGTASVRRNRLAALLAPDTSSPLSSSQYRGSPSASASQAGFVAMPTPPSISSARSRGSSFSFQGPPLDTRRRRKARTSFPYGPNFNVAEHGAEPRPTDGHRFDGSATETQSLRSEVAMSDMGDGGRPATDRALKGMGVLKEAVEEEGEMRREFIRWSALRKISTQVLDDEACRSTETRADDARRHASQPTVMAVAGGLIAIGTTAGRAIVFEYSQQIKCICDSADVAGSPGSVTALAFSSDHTFLGVGHETGYIFLYDLASPSRPSRSVPPVALSAVKAGKKEGHLNGSKIVHIGFVGLRHTAIVSADNRGLSFYHALGKIFGISSNDTLRLLGRYPQHEHEYELGLTVSKRSTIFGMAPLPLGSRPHLADDHHFIAIMTSGKLVIVGLKPSARTWYRKLRPRTQGGEERGASNGAESSKRGMVPGSLCWYPASTEIDGRRNRQTNPILAFCFGDRLHLVRFVSRKTVRDRAGPSETGSARHADSRLLETAEEMELIELTGKDGLQEKGDILAMQWLSPDLLVLVMKSGLALFDCRAGCVTERMEGEGPGAIVQRLVEHDWYNAILGIEPSATGAEANGAASERSATHNGSPPPERRSWAISHSVRASKGKLFFLTRNELVVGRLLSWADRLLAYVTNGDILSAIELATFFYEDQALGSAVGLPSDPEDRRQATERKLRDLMAASTEYAFNPDRLTDSTHVTPDGRGVDRTALFEGLAKVCARACLALKNLSFLFDVLYDRYEDNGIEGIFVAQMEQFIVSGELRTLPIPVVQRLLAFHKKQGEYDLAEKIIWHVDPKSLDLDQALSLCIDQRLYDAVIYVYNAALQDYVSPIIELLVPLRRILQVRRRVTARLARAKLRDRAAEAEEATQDGNPDDSGEVSGGLKAPSQLSSFDLGPMEFEEGDEQEFEDAYKIFSYLSVVLTGHQYPSQEPIEDEDTAHLAKTTIYSFVFSGRCMLWPPGPGGKLVLFGLDDHDENDGTTHSNNNNHNNYDDNAGHFSESYDSSGRRSSEPIYPYLQLFLEFDAEAFLDALDLAYEDPFLDDQDLVGKRISRQLIVDILLELSRSRSLQQIIRGASDDAEGGDEQQSEHGNSREANGSNHKQPALPALSRTFVNIFIARNAPKYPQFIKLGQADVDHLLHALAQPDLDDELPLDERISLTSATREDRQLATEYLLSTYKPDYTEERLDDFERAGFARILRSAFRQSGKWDRLLAMLIKDSYGPANRLTKPGSSEALAEQQPPSQRQAFAHIEEVVVKASRSKQRAEMMPKLHSLLVASIGDMLEADALKTVALLDRFFPEQHASAIRALQERDEAHLLLFLKCFFEPMQVLQSSRQREVEKALQRQSLELHTEEMQGDAGLSASEAPAPNFQERFEEHITFASPDHLKDETRDLYIDVLIRLDPDGVVRNLDARGARYFDLETVIALCRRSLTATGDAILWSLNRLGRAKEAFDELDRILAGAAADLGGAVGSEHQQSQGNEETAGGTDPLSGVRKAVDMAVRLCIEKANDYSGSVNSDDDDDDDNEATLQPAKIRSRLQPISMDEIWFRLLRSLVKLVHDVAGLSSSLQTSAVFDPARLRVSSALVESREIVEETLSRLIASTAAEAVSFPDLFRRLVGNGDAQSDGTRLAKYYTEVRAVLEGMLGAYKLRLDLLQITNKLFDRDTFYQFRRLTAQRKRGWRPQSAQARCPGCGQVTVGSKRGKAPDDAADARTGHRGHPKPLTSVGRDGLGMLEVSGLPRGPALNRRPSRDTGAGGTLRHRVLRNNSSSSLSIPQPSWRRRPATPYDEKAAPLSSPSIDKGKGVIRNASAHGDGFNDDVDGYFAGSLNGPATSVAGDFGSQRQMLSASVDSLMLRSASTSSGMSLRIDDRPRRERAQTTPSMARASSALDTRPVGRTPRRQMSDGTHYSLREDEIDGSGMARTVYNEGGAGSAYGTYDDDNGVDGQEEEEEEGEEQGQSAEDKADEAIVVLRSGLVYHESCWQDAEKVRAAA